MGPLCDWDVLIASSWDEEAAAVSAEPASISATRQRRTLCRIRPVTCSCLAKERIDELARPEFPQVVQTLANADEP